MKNFKEAGRRLYSRFGIHMIVLVTVCILGFFAIRSSIQSADEHYAKDAEYKAQQELLIDSYDNKLDSIQKVNEGLMKQQTAIDGKIDSIAQEQNVINAHYETEINIIRDATLSEHAQWFSSKLDSIRHNYKPDN